MHKNRLEAFSDGVIAIIITIMVLEMKVPHGDSLGTLAPLVPGQHPEPDGTFSFYGVTPSGFDFEIGAGGREIEPQG